jgi:hypothetical protein
MHRFGGFPNFPWGLSSSSSFATPI